jgi:non-specific serine/threonine protein kinase
MGAELVGLGAQPNADRARAPQPFPQALWERLDDVERDQQLVVSLVRELIELVRSRNGPSAGVPAACGHPERACSKAPAALEATESTFRREGEYWTVSHRGHVSRYRHTRGFGYLGRLLARPGQAFHVVELYDSFFDCGDAGPVIDAKAKEQYRRRLDELDDAVECATRLGDSERARQLRSEIESLGRHLNSALGLGGRHRKTSAVVERLRVNVTRAIRHTIDRIRGSDAQLANHLARSVRTGTQCAYQPGADAPCSWAVAP